MMQRRIAENGSWFRGSWFLVLFGVLGAGFLVLGCTAEPRTAPGTMNR